MPPLEDNPEHNLSTLASHVSRGLTTAKAWQCTQENLQQHSFWMYLETSFRLENQIAKSTASF